MTSRHLPANADLVYFTVTCHLAPIVADFSQDSDYDPNTTRIDAVVTFTPKYKTGEVIHSHTSNPPTGFLALPVTAMIDDGYLKLRSKPDLGAAPLPGTLHGLKAKIAADNNIEPTLEADGRAALNYAPVRLLGNSTSLEIEPDQPLFYDFTFSNIKIDNKQTNIVITGGTFEAPWEDTVIDLLDYMPLSPGPYAAPMVVGPQGPPGPPGPATIAVGSTTTSAPGSDAVVKNSGTNQDAVLDFVIPRGEPGPPGSGASTWDEVSDKPEGVPGGFPVLDADGNVPAENLPDVYAADIVDSTAVGQAVLTAPDEAAAREAIGAVDEASVKKLINLNAGYKAPALDILGDSITDGCGGLRPVSPTPSGTTYSASSDFSCRGYFFYALTLLSNRLRPGFNFGIGGQNTSQIKARVVDVLASPNPYVHVYAGINDLAQGVSLSTVQKNLLSIYTSLLEAGKIVTTATVAPSLNISGAAIRADIAAGVTSFASSGNVSAGDVLVLGASGNTETATVASVSGGSGSWTITLTAPTTKAHTTGEPFANTTRLTRLHELNQWIINYCQGRYVDPNTGAVVVNSGKAPHLVNWHSLVADPATGKPYGSLQPNGTVTTVAVDPLVLLVDGIHPGQDLAHRMGQVLAVVLDRLVPPLPIESGDNSEAGNLATNARCVGNVLGLATGFVMTKIGATPIIAKASKVPRTDGVPGEMQQVEIGPGNTGQLSLRLCDREDVTFTGNDFFVAEVEFETDNDLVSTGAVGNPLALRINSRNGSTLVDNTVSPFVASTDGAGTIWGERGVLKTRPVKISATANRIQVILEALNVDTGTFRVKSVRLRKVDL